MTVKKPGVYLWLGPNDSYSWYAIGCWWRTDIEIADAGVKLGPVTFNAYLWDGVRDWNLSFFGRWAFDTGIIRRGGPWLLR